MDEHRLWIDAELGVIDEQFTQHVDIMDVMFTDKGIEQLADFLKFVVLNPGLIYRDYCPDHNSFFDSYETLVVMHDLVFWDPKWSDPWLAIKKLFTNPADPHDTDLIMHAAGHFTPQNLLNNILQVFSASQHIWEKHGNEKRKDIAIKKANDVFWIIRHIARCLNDHSLVSTRKHKKTFYEEIRKITIPEEEEKN